MSLKRAFDIAVSSTLLAASLPLAAGLAITMRAVNGSAFFTQTRTGFKGKSFEIYKFKTMRDQFDASGRPLDDELRTTRIGMIVRKLHIDELPQLWHVLKGEMSLVGPRPLPNSSRFAADLKRQSILPGMIGPAQIAGANTTHGDLMLQLDHDYIDHHNFTGDLRLLLTSPLSVVRNWHRPHYNHLEQVSRNHTPAREI